ncbi:hypothetical protein HYQ44_015998 [Verticillium longisporum]|nr:hypothetical protein HYQ44_015998 [Verticillium longisporum]
MEFSLLLRTYRYPLRSTPLLRTQTSCSRTFHRRSFNSSSSNPNSSSTHNHSSSSHQASNSTLKAQHTAFDSPDQSLADRTSSPGSTTASAKSLPNMSSKLIPANPADVMVIRDVTPNITTFSVPFLRFGTIKVGGRGTLVRLSTGTLAIFSPVALTDDVRAKIAALGTTVSHIIAPDIEHHIFLSEWKAAFPDAKLIGPQGLPEKRAKQASSDDKIRDDPFAVVFEAGPAKRDLRIDPAFDADFDYEFVDAHPNKELVFYFRPDRVLIQADLFFNLPATEQYSRVPDAQKAPGLADRLFGSLQTTEGDGKWARRVQWHLFSAKDRKGYSESVRRIAEWDFETVIPCHGDTMVGDGKERFLKVFAWHLNGGKKL